MGSLPNLCSLSDDPNTTYKYELCDPDENNSSLKSNNGQNFMKCHHRFPTNSQNEVYRLKVNYLPNLDVSSMLKNQTYHKRARSVHTRSSGSQNNNKMPSYGASREEFMLQLSVYSPTSSRSSRSNVTSGPHTNLYNFSHSFNKRKDSLSSSGGASSVRKLIAIVRSTPSRIGPIYSRKVLCRNFAALCLGHLTVTAALLPLISLQSSVNMWWWPRQSLQQSSDAGSFFLCGSFAVASLFTLLSPTIIHLIGCNWTLVCGYVCTSAFFVAHLYPTIRCLIPAYLLLGICLGLLTCARISFLVTLANKLTYVMTEKEEIYEQINGGAKENIVQKLSRGLQASQDLGMVLGNVAAWSFLHFFQNTEQEKAVLRTLFSEDESGEWICGSQSTPYFERSITYSYYMYKFLDNILGNSTWYDAVVVSCRTTAMLASVFFGCGIFAVALTAAFTDKIRLFLYQDPLERPHGVAVFRVVKNAFKDIRLQLAAPLSVFIGLHQGFMHADFSKWYVVCSLGVSSINLVFLSMGILQSIAAFTLSLLLQSVPRYLVIAAGFIFHSCLLLVLLLWKPSGDDSALFYVIAAGWGVCNIIWETLNFDLLLHIYPDSTCQAAFVHGNFFKFLGMSLAFGVHGLLCTWIKLYALAFFMIVGITPHAWLEMKLESNRKMKSVLSSL